MLAVVSPAKSLNETPHDPGLPFSTPDFLDEAQQLIDKLKKMSAKKVSELMSISDKLGTLNRDRYLKWTPDVDTSAAKPALTYFAGDVYQGIDASSFNKTQFKYVDKHLRILSGLYGVIRPLDAIQAYRLEMGTKLKNNGGKNLYEFWGSKIALALQKQLSLLKSNTLINLSSNEYFKAIDMSALDVEVVTPVFKDLKKGDYKIVSFFAKKARGMMVREMVLGKVKKPEALKDVTFDGYEFRDDLSNSHEWVFTRDEKPE